MNKKLTPSTVVNYIRANQNNNKSLKALFASQLLGKLSNDELEGLQVSIEKELNKRMHEKADQLKEQLEAMGYEVVRK